jgi:UDP-N-acetyl-D-glucosamine dehydrogenase
MALLHSKGARLSYFDPFVSTLSARSWAGGFDLQSKPLTPSTFADVDCVVIVTDHRSVDYNWVASLAPLVVDTRNAIKDSHSHVFRLGAPRPIAAPLSMGIVPLEAELTRV